MNIGDIIYGTYITYEFIIFNFKGPYSFHYQITSADIANVNTFGTNLAAAISAQSGFPVSYTPASPPIQPDNLIIGGTSGGRTLGFEENVDDSYGYYVNNRYRGFKEGAIHKLGMIHYDSEMRQGNFEELPELYIPFVTETYPRSGSYAYIPEVYGIKLTVTSKPPIWAKYYKIVHKCSIQKTAQYVISDISYIDNQLTLELKSYDDFINGVSGLPTNFKSKGVADYVSSEWTDAKIRFLTTGVESSTMLNTARIVCSEYVESRIISVNSSSTLKVIITDFKLPLANIESGTLVEIYPDGYAPVYFELPISETANGYGLIDNPGEESRAYDFQSAGYIETYLGNIYKRWRIMTGDSNSQGQYFIESFSISDWWESDFYCKGRIQAETPNMSAQRIRTMLRWSGKLFENTNINNTNIFDEGNYRILETKFGAIEGIRQVGYTLKVAMWGNIASVFIGRREVQNADASTQLVITDSLIGTVNYSEDKYGCKHPGSIYVNDRTMFFFDIINRCFCKNDPNGSDDISMKKAQRYWQDLSQLIQENGYDVITGYDHSMGLVFVTIKSETATEEHSTTISFATKKGFWHGFHTFEKAVGDNFQAIDNIGNMGSSMVCFLNGEAWLMNSGTDYLNLFGDDVSFKVGAATNIEKKSVKEFMNHVCRSNRRLYKSTQTIPPSDTNPNGMESYIPGSKYSYKEGVYYSDCNNNKNTFGVPTTIEQVLRGLVSGDKLRGHACDTIVEFTGNEKVILKSLSMGVIPSPKS
jgi:hypothetical protein